MSVNASYGMIIYFAIVSLIPIVFGILCGMFTKKILQCKGYSSHWFWLGFLLGILGIIIALLMTETNTKEDVELKSVELLNNYKKLLDDGVISEEEFQKKKEELLSKC